MIKSDKIYCGNCGKEISGEDKTCPFCSKDLSVVGKHFSVTLEESLKLSDKEINKIDFRWDSSSLALFGVFITVFLSLVSLLKIWIDLCLSLIIGFFITAIFLIVINKINCISNFIVRVLRWLIKK